MADAMIKAQIGIDHGIGHFMLFEADSAARALDVHFVNPTPVHCGVGKVYNGGHC